MNKIDRMLACLGIFMLLFVPAVLVVFVITGGNEPTMLVGGITAAVVAEILALCRIKTGKQRQEYKDKNGE